MSALVATIFSATAAAHSPPPPTVYFNATVIHTVSAAGAEAFCVSSGKFPRVGGIAEVTSACGPTAVRRDLHGAAIIPGLIDSHLHLMMGGMKLARPQLDNASSPAEVVDLLTSWVVSHPVPPDGWLQGFGWDQERFPSKEFPTRADLDGAFPQHPVWLGRIDGHAAWANSAAPPREVG